MTRRVAASPSSQSFVAWVLQDRVDDMGDFEDQNIERNTNGAGTLWGYSGRI
jgi:hypothetical protein